MDKLTYEGTGEHAGQTLVIDQEADTAGWVTSADGITREFRPTPLKHLDCEGNPLRTQLMNLLTDHDDAIVDAENLIQLVVYMDDQYNPLKTTVAEVIRKARREILADVAETQLESTQALGLAFDAVMEAHELGTTRAEDWTPTHHLAWGHIGAGRIEQRKTNRVVVQRHDMGQDEPVLYVTLEQHMCGSGEFTHVLERSDLDLSPARIAPGFYLQSEEGGDRVKINATVEEYDTEMPS